MSFSGFHRRARKAGFTLVELLIVIAIMGLLGTVSVSGFYTLKKGMEQRSVMETVNKFIYSAYRRAIIDRVPTDIYFWNETISDDGDETGGKLVVVGHAVAVRQAGRLSHVKNNYLADEFGELKADAYLDEEGEEDDTATGSSGDGGNSRFLYRIGETSFRRSVVETSTVPYPYNKLTLMTDPTVQHRARIYAYKVMDAAGIDWKVGHPYGFEFAELTLPNNYTFGTKYGKTVNQQATDGYVINCKPNGDSPQGTVDVCGQKLTDVGDVEFEKIGTSQDPRRHDVQ